MINPTAKIHPQAIVEEGAKIGAEVVIGPFCIIGSDVEIGIVQFCIHILSSKDIRKSAAIIRFSNLLA